MRSTCFAAVTGIWLVGGISFGADGREDLIANGGFEESTSETCPGWKRLSRGQGVGLDDAVKRSGKKSLRVSSHGGVRSQLVRYCGGRVRVAGWMKTENVVRGERAWNKAALQLIAYDENQKPAGHFDIALVEGTHDWTRHERTVLLSREVAHIAVHCHIWGAKARGTVWFDDISLELLDDAKTFPPRKLDLAKATVTVEFGEERGAFRHLWIGSDVGHMDRVTSTTQVNAMRHARRFGFRYVRMHNCVHNPRIYAEDTVGNPIYRWETFDKRINAVVRNGMCPVVVLEGMPPEIATDDDGKGWQNPFPPNGEVGYRKWQHLCREIVDHCKATWGDDIYKWYFEVWNEPDAKGYFEGTQEEYFKIYDHAVAGATAADRKIRIGGLGGAGHGWVRDFLAHCRDGRNDATGQTGCRTDFLSWHNYTVGVGIPAFDNLRLSLNTVRETLADFPEFRNLPTIVTEWGCSSSPFAMHDRPYDAAYRVMAVRQFMDYNITLALPFALGAGPPHAHEGFQGSLAMFTKTTIPKPSFRAFELLYRMKGSRVECRSSNDPIGGLACISPDGSRAWVTLYNLIERHTHEPYQTSVIVKLKNLPTGTWSCTKTIIAPGVCDPRPIWESMGSPEKLAAEQRAALLKASELPAPQPVNLNTDRLQVDIAGFSIMQLELRRAR